MHSGGGLRTQKVEIEPSDFKSINTRMVGERSVLPLRKGCSAATAKPAQWHGVS
jgi:hypothetical protein